MAELTLPTAQAGGCSENAHGNPSWSPPKGLPGPDRRLTPSRWGVVSSKTTAQAERTTSKGCSCFYLRERLSVEPANMMEVVRCNVPYSIILTPGHKSGKRIGHSFPALKGRVLLAAAR